VARRVVTRRWVTKVSGRRTQPWEQQWGPDRESGALPAGAPRRQRARSQGRAPRAADAAARHARPAGHGRPGGLPAWAGVAVLLLAAACAAPEAPPNVVVFLIDTLRADRLGAYGQPESVSPRFDALAEQGVLFEQAYAPAPWTLPSTASILTSTPPCEHGVLLDGDRLPEALEPLAVRLRRGGRATASFFANPYAGPLSGLDRGFDRAELVPFEAGERVDAWLREVGDRPFFLYVHNVEPHDPYTAPTPRVPQRERRRANRMLSRYRSLTRVDWSAGRPRGTTDNTEFQRAALGHLERMQPAIEALYDADVGLADARLGGVVDALRRRGVWDRTLLVVLSDHGEAFGEHGGFQHDQSLYEELLRVPLLVRLPDDAHAGRRVAEPVSLLDVVPTIAAVLGEPEVARGSRGRSLLGHLGAGERPPDGPQVVGWRVNRKKYFAPWDATRGDVNAALRQGPWKAVWNREPGSLELYDLSRDPGEQHDRSAALPERARAFRRAGQAALSACPTPDDAARGAPSLDDETRRRLENLGYIDP